LRYFLSSFTRKAHLDLYTLQVFIVRCLKPINTNTDRQLEGGSQTFETYYQEIEQRLSHIKKLDSYLGVNQFVHSCIVFCIVLLIFIPSILLIIISSVIFLILFCRIIHFKNLEKFIYLHLLFHPDRSVSEVIKECKELVRKSNINQFNFIAGLTTISLLALPCSFLAFVVFLFFPRYLLFRIFGYLPFPILELIALLALPLLFYSDLIEFYSVLYAVFYYKMLCLQAGWDISLTGGKMEIERKVKILTPESVELEFSLAGIGNRALALLIDYGILFLCLFCLFFVWLFVGEQLYSTNEDLTKWFNAFMSLLYFVIYAGYFVFFETVWSGQTPGKRLVNVRAIQSNGRPVGLVQSSLRALLRPFDDFLSFGAYLIIFGKMERRLGDIVAQTIVIQEPRRPAPVSIDLSSKARQAAKEWSKLGITDRLTVDDFAVIKDYLQRRKHFTNQARLTVSDRLMQEIRDKLELTEIPLGFTTEEHLEGIYLSFSRNKQNTKDLM
jgi:uncharacterized RDD family membrane protein YckC